MADHAKLAPSRVHRLQNAELVVVHREKRTWRHHSTVEEIRIRSRQVPKTRSHDGFIWRRNNMREEIQRESHFARAHFSHLCKELYLNEDDKHLSQCVALYTLHSQDP